MGQAGKRQVERRHAAKRAEELFRGLGRGLGLLAGLAGERMRRRGRRLVTRRGRQVRVFGPEAERAARPDPMYDPHARLPPGETR